MLVFKHTRNNRLKFQYGDNIVPSYKSHDKINLACLIILVIAAIHYKINFVTLIIFTLSFLFGSRYLSPDIDVDSRIYRRWGLLRFFWKPYKDLFKHRGISHNLILGPVTLIGYLAGLIFICLYLAGVPLQFDVRMGVIAAGMVAAIELHILADMFLSKK